jgi:large subunit ribosomal protein L14
MIQKGTYLNVVDNSGAKLACCIHVYDGYKKKYAKVGDKILVSVKSLRKKKQEDLKIKKGEISKAFVVCTKKSSKLNKNVEFLENSIVLLTNQEKYLGTRIFIPLLKTFRHTKYLKALSMSSGIIY